MAVEYKADLLNDVIIINNFINNPIDPSLVTDTTDCGICPNTTYTVYLYKSYSVIAVNKYNISK